MGMSKGASDVSHPEIFSASTITKIWSSCSPRFRIRFEIDENYFARRESFSSIPASYRLRAFLDQ